MSYILLYIQTKKLMEQLEQYRGRTPEQILEGGAEVAKRLESIAKRNAPWTDRTGNARRTMRGIQGFEDENHYYIGIAGYMPYSFKLERWYNRRYAILTPTMRQQNPFILDDIRTIISKAEGFNRSS